MSVRRLTRPDLETIHGALMTLMDMVAADDGSFEPGELDRIEAVIAKIRERMR